MHIYKAHKPGKPCSEALYNSIIADVNLFQSRTHLDS